jgi:hypothetical protein
MDSTWIASKARCPLAMELRSQHLAEAPEVTKALGVRSQPSTRDVAL